MKKTTRILSFLLVLILTVNLFPVSASVADAKDVRTKNKNTRTEAADMEITGTGSVGNMVADALTKEKAGSIGEYYISGLEVKGKLAAVTCSAAKDCDVVVAVYDEAGKQMLASGTAKLTGSEDEEKAYVTVEGTMPDYFTASAYLLDRGSHAPLCKEYTTQMYTKELQDFEDMTVNDFREDQVLNLDDDPDSNFAIYNDQVVKIKEKSGSNELKEQENGIYTVQNAGIEFTSLKRGALFSYTDQAGKVLVARVKDVRVSGDTVTITEDKDIKLEDVFDYVKIEGGYRPSAVGRAGNALDFEDDNHSMRKDFSWSKQLTSGSLSASLTASGEMVAAPYIKLYLSLHAQYIEATVTFSASFQCSVSGKAARQSVDLLKEKLLIPLAPGVTVSFMPKMDFEASGEASFKAKMVAVTGFSVDGENGFFNKSSKPQLTECDFKMEAKVYLGLRIMPDIRITIAKVDAGSASLDAEAGVQITGKMDISGVKGNTSHLCKACIKGDVNGKIRADGTVSVLFFGSRTDQIINSSMKVCDFYYSIDKKEFGWRTCPHIAYKVILSVTNENGAPVPGAVIEGTELETDPVTDVGGKAEFFLKKGVYLLETETEELEGSLELEVQDTAREAEMQLKGLTVIASGTCGSDLKWKLQDSGRLTISGTGDMTSWSWHTDVPWYKHREKITSVILEGEPGNVGAYAFFGASNLEEVKIPGSVTFIGKNAFQNCGKLTDAVIPEGVTSIGEYAFGGCSALTEMDLPAGMLQIDKGAFHKCSGLKSLKIPDSVIRIDVSAFEQCTGLLRAEIGGGRLGDSAFKDCTSLVSATLGENISAMGSNVFFKCSSLKSIAIPNKVTRIESNAFNSCISLTSVNFGSGITFIGDDAFGGCVRLGEIDLPNGVTEIGSKAFSGCTSLFKAKLGNSVNTIGHSAFRGCSLLGEITFPASVTLICDYAFEECSSLSTILFLGNRPDFRRSSPSTEYYSHFGKVTATVYYPPNDTWKPPYKLGAINLTWIPSGAASQSIAEDSAESVVQEEAEPIEQPDLNEDTYGDMEDSGQSDKAAEDSANEGETIQSEIPKAFSPSHAKLAEGIIDIPKTASEQAEEQKQKAVRFTELAAGEACIMLMVKNPDSSDLLSPDNLLYIAQGEADSTGAAVFLYIPRTSAEGEFLICGARGAKEPVIERNPDMSVIGRTDISGCTAELSNTAYTYDGKAKMPDVTVRSRLAVLVRDKDYQITYSNNINAGTATVIIKGCGNYTGTKTMTFSIRKADNIITANNITKTSSKKAQNFSLPVRAEGGARLDFKSSHKSVKVNGEGKITVSKKFVGQVTITVSSAATDNYNSASREITVTVNPAKVRLTGAKAVKGKKVSVKWKKNSLAGGYQIQYCTSRKFGKGTKIVKVSGAKKSARTLSKLKKGKKYYVRIRAYKKVSKKIYYSGWSNIKTVKVK